MRGFVVDARMEDDTRVVTFFNGAVAREVLVGIDEEARRLAYQVVDGPIGFTHHMASAQVFCDHEDGSRFVWITDARPDSVAGPVGELMEKGIQAIKETLESDAGAR